MLISGLKKGIVIALLLLATVTSVAVSPACAQVKGDSVIVQVPDGKKSIPLTMVMNSLGMEDRELLNRFLSGAVHEATRERHKRQKNIRVIKHIRGEDGVPLKFATNPLGMVRKVIPTPVPGLLEKDRERREKLKAEYEKKFKKVQPEKVYIRECAPDEVGTEKRQTGAIEDKRIASILETDVLFISKRHAVENPKTTFGKYAQVLLIEPGAYHEFKLAKSLKVKCLPFRFRATKRMNFRHSGDDALKNYDDDFLGNGKFAGSFAHKGEQ